MKKYIILLILIITALTSCKKDKDKLSGNAIQAGIYVKQYKTETPIANAMILITRGAPHIGFGTTILDTLYTDANGRVAYNKVVDQNYLYFAEAYKEGFFDTHNAQVLVTPGEKNFTTTIFMYAHSWVKLHVKNVNPYDQFDYITIQSFCNTFYLQGISIDSTFLWCFHCHCKWKADFDYEIALGVTKNQSLNTIHLAFTPPPTIQSPLKLIINNKT